MSAIQHLELEANSPPPASSPQIIEVGRGRGRDQDDIRTH